MRSVDSPPGAVPANILGIVDAAIAACCVGLVSLAPGLAESEGDGPGVPLAHRPKQKSMTEHQTVTEIEILGTVTSSPLVQPGH
jgi:hypothetical protein